MIDIYDISQRAQKLLEDPATVEAFKRLRERYQTAWENTKSDDVVSREAAYHALRGLNEFRSALKSLADAPKVTAFNKRGGTT